MSEETAVTVTMSASVGAIGAALAKAQLAMRPAVKDATNPHYKNRYATLASCVEALRPLHENGIAVIQPPAVHGADGVCVSTLLVHSSGEWIRGELYMPASKRDPQGFGSALSYARRYCLTATTGLATDDDDGEAAVRSAPSLEKQLSASVEWGAWEARQTKALRGSKSRGELLEQWTSILEEGKDSPNGSLKRLAAVKDECKAALASSGAEVRP
jgi:hypothetical protein